MLTVCLVHGHSVEVTCMGIDPSGYRLVTGAKNGSIKVWDFSAGQELKHRQHELQNDENEPPNEKIGICDIYYVKIKEDLFITVFGKDNKIQMFLVSGKIKRKN